MLTVLIEAGTDAPALATSLAALVPGAVEGIVREVVVLDVGMEAGARKVCDHAGCRVVPAGALASAVTGAKGEWLLLVEVGSRLSAGWTEAVALHVAEVEEGRRTPRAARFSLSSADRPGLFARLRRRRTALADGFLLPKAQAVGQAKSAASLPDLARGLASTRLDAVIRPALQSR